MFCENCGTQLNDDDLFCTKCGKRVTTEVPEGVRENNATEAAEVSQPEADVQEEKVVEEAVVEEAVVEEAVVEEKAVEEKAVEEKAAENVVPTDAQNTAETVENTVSQQKDDVAEEAAKEEKGEEKGFVNKILQNKVILIVLAAVLVVLLLVGINFASVSNLVLKTVLSPEKYYSHVEKAEIKEISSIAANMYENVFLDNADIYNTSVDTEVYLEFGEDAQELIAEYIDVDDTEWLEKIGVELGVAVKDEVLSGNMVALLGKDQLISGSAVFDMGDGTVFAQVPELTDKYLGVDLEDAGMGYYYDADEYSEIMAQYEELYKTLPDKKVVERLINRYLLIAVENIDSVKKKTDTLEVKKISQNCTVLRIRLNQTDMLNIAEAICEEAKEDKELIEVVSSVVAVASNGEMDADDVRDEFVESIEDALDNIDDSREYANSGEEIIMNVWVNGKGEVVGRDISVGDDYSSMEMKYYMPQKGSNFALEMAVQSYYDNFEVKGVGKKSSSTLNGEFEVAVSGMELADIVVENYNINEAKKGYLKGDFSIKPSKSVWNELGVGSASALLSGYALDIEADMGANKSELAIALDDDGEVFAKLVATVSTGSGRKANVPKDKAIMVEDESDLMDWIDEIDFAKFIKKINKTKLPVELIEAIEDLCDYAENLPIY